MIKLISIADLISMINVGFGFLSIFVLLSGNSLFGEMRFHIAFSFILLALLADGLDGIVARKIRTGPLGEYIESMADMISMGIAPLVFIFCSFQMQIIGDFSLVIVIAGIFLFYLFCCVIRLASFYLLKNDGYFIGLPASAATIILVVLVSIHVSLLVIIISVIILSIFLLSSIPFPKPKKIMNVVAAVLIIVAIIIGDQFNFLFFYLLLFGILLYTIGGSIAIYLKKTSN